MYKRKFWLDQEQPNLGYADVKLNIACMHPLACLHTLSLCVYYDLYGVNGQLERCKSLWLMQCPGLKTQVRGQMIRIPVLAKKSLSVKVYLYNHLLVETVHCIKSAFLFT